MVVYTLEQRWEVLRQIDLQKITILEEKIIFSDEAHFDLGAQKTRTHTLKSRRPQNELLFCADFGSEA